MTWWRPSRFQGYLLISAALIGSTAAAAGLAAGRFFEARVLAAEEEYTARVVRAQAAERLSPAEFRLPLGQAQHGVFRTFFGGLTGVFRVKVFDPAGRIVWSNEPRLIGLTLADNPYLARALGGAVVTVLGAPGRPEHVYEKERTYIAEAYVPITFSGHSGVVGVIETYRDMTAVVRDIRETRRLVWSVALGLGVLLYAALAWVVWRARIDELRAIGRLEAQNRELTLIQHFTRSVLHPLDLPPLAANMLKSAVTGLGLSGAALYAAGPRDGLARVACWPPSSDDTGAGVREMAVETSDSGPAVIRDDAVAMPLPTRRETRYLLVARFRHAIAEADLATVRTLEIMLNEAAIALENAELFGEVRGAHRELVRKAEELERANRALREAQARLVERERLAAVGETVVGLHHAILNPLTGILGALQILKQEQGLRPAIAQVVTEAEGEIRKIEQVVRRLASLRRAERTPYVGGTAMLDVERSSE